MTCRLLALLAVLITFGGCTGPPAEPEPAALRVMSFNVRLDVASDGADAWPHRRDAVARVIAGADLVGVQEALPAMLADLDARLPIYARLGTGRDADGGGEQSAILYRTDRLTLLDGGTFWLSATPDVPGSRGWDAALARIATWGRFRDRRTGREIVHANTHFDHRGVAARRESARLLATRLPTLANGAALVLTGDLNATPEAEPIRLLAAAGLADARAASAAPPTGPAGTWTDFGRVAPTDRIDYVFTAGPVRVRRFRTLDGRIGSVMETDDMREVSDHYAVEATVELGTE